MTVTRTTSGVEALAIPLPADNGHSRFGDNHPCRSQVPVSFRPIYLRRGALTSADVARIIGAMARSVSVIITDDIDGSENAETVSFGFRGVTYEVDLGKKNQAKLERALAPFIEAGRRAPSGGRRRTASRARGSSADHTAVRAWARTAGLKVSERGRLSADIVRQYEDAH
jgi:thiazole synthase ThiGH ThiG subunit